MPTTLKTDKTEKKKDVKYNLPKLTEEMRDNNTEAMVINLLKKKKK